MLRRGQHKEAQSSIEEHSFVDILLRFKHLMLYYSIIGNNPNYIALFSPKSSLSNVILQFPWQLSKIYHT